jgi:hypothetical protein
MENYFRGFFPSLLRIKPFLLVSIIIITFLSQNTERYSGWAKSGVPFSSDIDQYYSYLPQTFIHHDPTFRTAERYWTTALPNGNKIQRFTIGVAIMEAPFFFIGHQVAKMYDYPADGYSPPYGWALYYGVVLYVLFGLFFSYKTLRFYFNEWFSSAMVFTLFFATNLFYYSVAEALMSHSFLFFLQSGFLYFVLRWYQSGKWTHLFTFVFLGAFSVLIRPTEILIFLFPLLIGIHNGESLRQRLSFLTSKRKQLLSGTLIFMLVLLPQLFYWKFVTGSWVYYSYGDEGFFFSAPKWLSFIFGYRKGLIPYSPILIFAFLGFIVMWKKRRELFYAIVLFFLINSYLLSCWWDYGFGGGLGNRALVQSYSSLLIPFALFFDFILTFSRKPLIRYSFLAIMIVVVAGLIQLNLLMVRQYKATIIHWVGMNQRTYWFVFGKEKFTQKDFETRERLIHIPDFNAMKKGNRDQ